MAVIVREAHRARMVFGANLSCAAASSVVRRFDNIGLTPRSSNIDEVRMNQTPSSKRNLGVEHAPLISSER